MIDDICNLREYLTEDEQKTACEMIKVFWGVDLDEVRQRPVADGCYQYGIPVIQEGSLQAYWASEGETSKVKDGPLLAGKLVFDDPISKEKVDELYARWMSLYQGPRFFFETIPLDRWIVPWKVRAGYSGRINMLAFRVEGELR